MKQSENADLRNSAPPDPKVVAKVTELLTEAKLSAREKSDLFALAGAMSDSSDHNAEDFLLAYLSGKRNWRSDFQQMFGYEPAKNNTTKKK